MTELKVIDTLIASIAKRGKALRLDAHKAVVMVLEHYMEHGDFTRLEKLQSVVDQTFGRSCLKAMNVYVQNFGAKSLKWNTETSKFEHLKGVNREWVAEEIEIKATKTAPAFKGHPRDYPFFNCEEKKDPTPFVLESAYSSLLDKARKEYEKELKATGTANLKLARQIKVLEEIHLEKIGEDDVVDIEVIETLPLLAAD